MIWRDFIIIGSSTLFVRNLADRDQKRSTQASHLGVDSSSDVAHGVAGDDRNALDTLRTVQASSLADVGHSQAASLANAVVAERSNYTVLSSGHLVQQRKKMHDNSQDALDHDVQAAAQKTEAPSATVNGTVNAPPKATDSADSEAEAALSPLQYKALEVVAKDELFAERGDPLIESGLTTMSSVLSDARAFFVQLPGMKEWMIELKRAVDAQPQEQRGKCLTHGDYKGFGCFKANKRMANICSCRGYLEMCIIEEDKSKIAELFVQRKKAEALKLAKSMLLGECQTPTWVYVSIFTVGCIVCVVGGFLLMCIFSRRRGCKSVAKPSSLPNPPKTLEIKKHESFWRKAVAAGTEAFANAWNSTVDAVRNVLVSKPGSVYTVAD